MTTLSLTPILYSPSFLCDHHPSGLPDCPSAWHGLERVLPDILRRFDIPGGLFLEFGVDYGFSTAVFSCHARTVIGVDTFEDIHSGGRSPEAVRSETEAILRPYPNITLVRMDYREFCPYWDSQPAERRRAVDLIHIDIDHSYETTLELGEWAVANAPVVLFHDTHSHPLVGRAVADLARRAGCFHYDYPAHFGLGILSRREVQP